MSFSSDYNKLRKKRLEEAGLSEEQVTTLRERMLDEKLSGKNDIGPVYTPTKEEKEEERTWFTGGAFDDGYQFGDLFKTMYGSGADLVGNVAGGLLEIGEGVVDAGAFIAGAVGGAFGAKDFAEDTKKFISNDLYSGEEVANRILTLGLVGEGGFDDVSIWGERVDSLAQSGGQLAGNLAITAATGGVVPWWLTTGVTSFGQEADRAFDEGADYLEAGASGLISAGAEILTEKLFGGSGLGERGFFNLDGLTKGISSKFVKAVADLGVDMAAEGTEEVISSALGKFGEALYSEKNLGELLTSEEALDEYLESFIGGAALGGIMNSAKVNNARAKNGGRDYRTGLTENEQKVFDKVYEEALAEETKSGKELSKKDKAKLYDEVMDSLQKGGISTDIIEEVLGGDSYKAYKDAIDSDNAAIKELEGLYEGEELDQKIKDILDNSKRGELKEQLSKDVFGIAESETSLMRNSLTDKRNSFLYESYSENAKRGQKFTADLSQYDEKHRSTVQKAIDSGILNNTRRTHEMVDLFAKLSADKGVEIDFTSNEKIKGTSFAVEGKTVNGYVTENGDIAVNIDSPRYLNSIVGHEITHILEGTELYKELQKTIEQYAESKGEYKDRLRATMALYKDVEGYKGADGYNKIKREVVADLVGDYLFTDNDFVRNLHNGNRNLFQKIWDEIKYMYKVATAGSKEAKQLEAVKRAFEKAYQEGGKATGGVKHSLSEVNPVQPTSDKWRRTLTTEEAKARFPKLWDVTADESEVRNPTQISSTVRSYRKVYDHLKAEGFNGTILDASSGLGYGTKAGIEEYGFDVEDIEPYPDKGYNPKYKDYSTLDKKYDVVISNAVLNVLPQDQRDALVIKMGEMLNDGGRIFINVRGKDVDTLASNENNTNISPMEWFVDSTGSYQKGFNKPELVAYLQDALGDGFTVKPTNMFGAVSAVVTKNSGVKYSLSAEQEAYFKDSVVRDRDGNLLKVYHTTNNDFTVFDKARKGEATGDGNTYMGFFFADDAEYMQNFPEFENGKTEAYYLNIKNPIDMTNISEDAFLDVVEVLGGDVYEAADVYEEALAENNGEPMHLVHLLQEMVGDTNYTELVEELKPHYDELMSKGYDGVINYLSEYHGTKEYIVLDSNQAKLTTNVKPTKDADIRYSLTDIEGKPIDSARISTSESDVTYSLSHNTEIAKGQSDYVLNKKAYVSADELEEAQKVTNAMVDVMMKYSSILPEDKIGKVLTKNGSYDRSVENTTICVRTLAYNEFVDKVQEQIGRPLTQMESFLVSQKLYDIATEPQCLYCYVSLDRKAFNDMLLRYMTDRDTVIAKYNNSDKSHEAISKLYEEFLNGRKDTKNMKERFDKWIDYVDNGTQLLSLADIATEDRQSVINAEGGILADQLKDARAYAQSASWSKIQKNYVAYRDEILKLGDRVVKNLNEHYGMRWYSFSDYSAAFIVENMQQITDASIRGLKGLAYTKDTDFAEVFAPSGMNINVSVFVNQDEAGSFYIDEKQSANFEKAMDLRERYPNVGIVATVTNDDALRWVGEQGWSDVIIPFHIVRTGTDVAEYYKWLNYTSESADTVGDNDLWNAYVDSLNLKSENARKKVSKNIYPNEHKNDKATYLALCESRGLTPRFARFAGEPWYMKLVNETRLSSDESTPLKPNYNLEAAKASFQKFVDKGGYEGGWYKDGVDVDSEAAIVAEDVLAGKKANEVDYGRQDRFNPEAILGKRKKIRGHGFSLSEEGIGPDPIKRGNLNIRGEDVRLEAPTKDDIGPVRSDAAKAKAVDGAAPIYAPGSDSSEEYDAEFARESFEALGDMDAPFEQEEYGAPRETTQLPKTKVVEIAQRLRDELGLTNRQMSLARGLVEEYSKNESFGKEELYETIKAAFGKQTFTEDTGVKDVQAALRKYKLKVSDAIIKDIADFKDFRKALSRKVGFSKDGIDVDVAYEELSAAYPDLFPADIVNPTDRLLKIADIATMEKTYKEDIELDDNTLRNAADIIVNEVNAYNQKWVQKLAERQAKQPFSNRDIPVTQAEFDSRADKFYRALAGKPIERLQRVGGYSFYIMREPETGAARIIVSNKNGETTRRNVEGADRLTDAQLWRKAAEVATESEMPYVMGSADGDIGPVAGAEKAVDPAQIRLENSLKRIDQMLEYDKADLDEEFQIRREDLQNRIGDKASFVSRRAMELYTELSHLKKGVRASKPLGHLLDYGYPWQEIKRTLLDIRSNPDKIVRPDSVVEQVARETLREEYHSALEEFDDISSKYDSRLKELEDTAETKRKNARTANQRRNKQDELSTQMEEIVGDTSTWVDKKLGLSYKTNTLRRNLRDVVRDANGNRDLAKADAIYEMLQGKYNQHEAELNREANRIKKVYADMKITDAESTYIQMLGEFRHNPDSKLTEQQVKDFLQKHKSSINEAKVDRAIELARETYDSLLLRVNEVLRENGMKEIPYRQGYFPHFTEEKQGFLAKLFNWKTQNDDIPTDIAGLTEQFNPNRSWQSFNKQRKGDETDYNFLKGMDSYVFGALDWIYHIEDIQNRRAFENHLRYTHSEEGVKKKIDAIRANDELDADEVQEQIDLVYATARNPLNNFVTDLRAGTNKLANKKSSLDRGMEEMVNRKVYSTMTNLSNRVSANMVGGSISSALTNFIPITQSWGEVSPISSLRAMVDTIRSAFRDDGTIDKSDFLTNRLRSVENLHKTGWDRFGEGLGALMEGIDSFTAQTVWRSKYLENISKGMAESEAIKNADQFAENVIAGRSRGNMPTIFDSKNPLMKTLTAFQLEVNNQYGYMFKDMPQDVKDNSKGRLIKGYATMFLGAYAYNALFSALTGRDAALDPVGIIEDLLRDLGLFGEDEEEEPVDAMMNFAENIVQEVPFVGGLVGGGRVPISSALPYEGNLMEMLESTGKAIEDQDYAALTKEWMKPLYYLAMPMGGGQLKKSLEGLSMFEHPIAGSYTDSGALRFPVEDTPINRIQAGLFGQWANENAREYFEAGHAPLDEKHTEEFADSGLSIQDYWAYREGLSDLNKASEDGNATLAEQADYIFGLDMPIETKNLLINNLSQRKEPIDLSGMGEYSGFEEYDFATDDPDKYKWLKENGITVEQYKGLDEDAKDELDFVYKYPEKYSFLRENGYSYSTYKNADEDGKRALTWASENPDKYQLSKAVTGDLFKYRKLTGELYDIKADKDANGKTISGSRKKKVVDYINGLDLEYGEKIILYKSEYESDDTYNMAIIDYLNSREDISFDEMAAILRELGFTVDSQGNITW